MVKLIYSKEPNIIHWLKCLRSNLRTNAIAAGQIPDKFNKKAILAI